VDIAACAVNRSVSWLNALALLDEGDCTTGIIIHSDLMCAFRSQLIFNVCRDAVALHRINACFGDITY